MGAEAEDPMVDTMAVVIEVGTLEDSAAGILAEDPVLLLYPEETMERTMLLPYPEYTMGVIEVGIMVDIVEGTMAVIGVDTIEGSMVEVFTHIGDYGDGDFGDGLFWDGPMRVGPTMPMEDTHIWDGPTIHHTILPV